MSLAQSLPVIFAPSGPVLTADERAFFQDVRPLGFILFRKDGARNVENPAQLYALTQSLRELLGWRCPVLTDQEGGRVQRLRPPHWRQYPPMKIYGDRALSGDMAGALEDLRFSMLQMAEELQAGGIDITCAPVLDVLQAETHDIIGDRAFASDPNIVGRLGASVCRTLLSAGITPVIKHIPGHGRARVDSHKDLPIVSASQEALKNDFEPFRIVSNDMSSQGVWAMVAHIIYSAIDLEKPASISPRILTDIIRKHIGFEGVLVSDDLDMLALAPFGDVGQRAKLCLEAGCDIALQCSGNLSDMINVAKAVPNLREDSLKRLQNWEKLR